MKQQRRHWSSKVFKQIKVGDDTVFVPIVDDLEDEHLIWHFDRAMDEEDYEYASTCKIEADNRGIGKYLKT